jgi:hypothetical protein
MLTPDVDASLIRAQTHEALQYARRNAEHDHDAAPNESD